MRRTAIVGGSVLAVGVGLVAARQGYAREPRLPGPPPGPPPAVILALDADHDGELSAEEIAGATEALLTLDTNEDGVLTPDEFGPRCGPGGHCGPPPSPEGRHGPRPPSVMDQDANNDGVVSLDEFLAPPTEAFDRFDANGDGRIDADEAPAVPPPPPPRHPPAAMRRGARGEE